MTSPTSPPELPELPPPHRTQNALRCMACKKPYQPRMTENIGSLAHGWHCECGCETFERVIGYEPQPEFIAPQMREYGIRCYEAGREAERERCAKIAEDMVDYGAGELIAAIRKG
jgi:hypothetical protein